MFQTTNPFYRLSWGVTDFEPTAISCHFHERCHCCHCHSAAIHSSPCHNGGTLGDSVHQHLCNDAQGPASGGKDVHRTIGERLKNEAEKNSAFPKESKEF